MKYGVLDMFFTSVRSIWKSEFTCHQNSLRTLRKAEHNTTHQPFKADTNIDTDSLESASPTLYIFTPNILTHLKHLSNDQIPQLHMQMVDKCSNNSLSAVNVVSGRVIINRISLLKQLLTPPKRKKTVFNQHPCLISS